MPHPLLVDSHCHLPLIDHSQYQGGLDEILDSAKHSGIGHMLCVSVDLGSFPAIHELLVRHDHIFASVGVHPNSEVATEPTVRDLVNLSRLPGVVAIGETGLDYFRSRGDLQWQRDRFRTHITAARQAGLPLIIHTRDAREDVIAILTDAGAEQAGGVMHCFVEDWATAKAALDLGFYISFSGIVTFKNATEVQDIARRVPEDRLLVETDSPYLAPVPHRGKQNQPAFVADVARFMAELRGVEYEHLVAATTENFFRLFSRANIR
jgi:TatD DNase family protein